MLITPRQCHGEVWCEWWLYMKCVHSLLFVVEHILCVHMIIGIEIPWHFVAVTNVTVCVELLICLWHLLCNLALFYLTALNQEPWSQSFSKSHCSKDSEGSPSAEEHQGDGYWNCGLKWFRLWMTILCVTQDLKALVFFFRLLCSCPGFLWEKSSAHCRLGYIICLGQLTQIRSSWTECLLSDHKSTWNVLWGVSPGGDWSSTVVGLMTLFVCMRPRDQRTRLHISTDKISHQHWVLLA